MGLTGILYICFFSILAITGIGFGIYYQKQYDIDPITGELMPKKEIERNTIRRQKQDNNQLINDELAQINNSMRKIGDVCPEFHQKYGKAMDIICHIERMKVLVREYGDIPDGESLVNYQHEFYLKVYDSIKKDIFSITEPYFIGRKEIDKKYHGKIDLRKEFEKFTTHLNQLKQLSNSSH